MKQLYHLTKQIIRPESHLFKIRRRAAIALIDIARTKGFQGVVTVKLAQKVAARHHFRAIELERPDVTLSGFGNNLFVRQGQTATVAIVGKGIRGMSILEKRA